MAMPWARTVRRRRHYIDASTMLPARSLREHGADMVIACNCVASPSDGKPLASFLRSSGLAPAWLAEVLARHTLAGRLSDALIAASFSSSEAGRTMEHDAHVYIEPSPEPLAMLESLAFFDAARLVRASEEDLRRQAGPGADLVRAAQTWEAFRRTPPRSA